MAVVLINQSWRLVDHTTNTKPNENHGHVFVVLLWTYAICRPNQEENFILFIFFSLLTIHSVVVTINTLVNHQQSVDMHHLVERFVRLIISKQELTFFFLLLPGRSYCCSSNRSCSWYNYCERRLNINGIILDYQKEICWLFCFCFVYLISNIRNKEI